MARNIGVGGSVADLVEINMVMSFLRCRGGTARASGVINCKDCWTRAVLQRSFIP